MTQIDTTHCVGYDYWSIAYLRLFANHDRIINDLQLLSLEILLISFLPQPSVLVGCDVSEEEKLAE